MHAVLFQTVVLTLSFCSFHCRLYCKDARDVQLVYKNIPNDAGKSSNFVYVSILACSVWFGKYACCSAVYTGLHVLVAVQSAAELTWPYLTALGLINICIYTHIHTHMCVCVCIYIFFSALLFFFFKKALPDLPRRVRIHWKCLRRHCK